MHGDNEVAILEMSYGKPIGFKEILNIEELPVGTLGATKGQEQLLVGHWYKSRSIPNQRVGIFSLQEKMGISKSEMFLRSAGVSLTDTYWFKDETLDNNITWKDINFYDNGFNPIFANIYLNNENNLQFEKCPDFTTDGIMEKFWYSVHDRPYLAKVDTKMDGILSANEVVYSQIADIMNIKTTPYIFGESNVGRFCSCPCFINDSNEDFISAMQVKHSNFQLSSLRLFNYFMKELNFEEQIKQMITLDCLFHNVDRHEKNFGFIKTKNEIRFAPLFDNGYCLGANRDRNSPITNRDIKLFNDTRESILEEFGVSLQIDKKIFLSILQNVYEDFQIPEDRFMIAKEELEVGCELLENNKEQMIYISKE